jgi:hypothetical protein
MSKIIGLFMGLMLVMATAHAETPVQNLEKMQIKPADAVSVQEEANRKAAADVRRNIQEVVNFQTATWKGARNCQDSRISWATQTYSGATEVPRDIWDCAPYACDAGKGVCKSTCEKGNNGCASNAECVMTNASGQNGVCVTKK